MSRFCSFFVVAAVGLLPGFAGAAPHRQAAWPTLPPETAKRVVFVAGEMAEEDQIALAANLAASQASRRPADRHARLQQIHQGLLGPVPARTSRANWLLSERNRRTEGASRRIDWFGPGLEEGMPTALGTGLFPHSKQLVVCPAEPRRLLLQSAYFAGVLRAPLLVVRGNPGELARLQRWLATWQVEEIHAVGATRALCQKLRHVRRHYLADEPAVAAAAIGS